MLLSIILKIELQMLHNGLSNMRPHFRGSFSRRVTDNSELTVKIFTLKWGKDNERAKSSFSTFQRLLKYSEKFALYV